MADFNVVLELLKFTGSLESFAFKPWKSATGYMPFYTDSSQTNVQTLEVVPDPVLTLRFLIDFAVYIA